MDRERPPWGALTVAVLVLSIGVLVVSIGARWTVPDEQAYVSIDQWDWAIEGATVVSVAPDTLPPDRRLLDGDIVAAIDGRSLEAWADAAFRPFEPGPPVPDPTEELRIDAIRAGVPTALQVQPGPFPVGRVLAEGWPLIVFIGLLVFVSVFIALRRTRPRGRARPARRLDRQPREYLALADRTHADRPGPRRSAAPRVHADGAAEPALLVCSAPHRARLRSPDGSRPPWTARPVGVGGAAGRAGRRGRRDLAHDGLDPRLDRDVGEGRSGDRRRFSLPARSSGPWPRTAGRDQQLRHDVRWIAIAFEATGIATLASSSCRSC